MIKACVKKGKHAGTHVGVVAVRSSGSFDIREENCVTQGIKFSNCKLLQKFDGYKYEIKKIEEFFLSKLISEIKRNFQLGFQMTIQLNEQSNRYGSVDFGASPDIVNKKSFSKEK